MIAGFQQAMHKPRTVSWAGFDDDNSNDTGDSGSV
jgi:hypothetical protein